jgi:hypothetical protein
VEPLQLTESVPLRGGACPRLTPHGA